ncbi:MAG: aspartate carbamoyltransferase regulatory subunit [Muribaculaceae bacterium]|nr:aspartate carbamoyltransferase regulatory subunit [Muribaculaceae bacterium]MDE5972222.1 aspartate carbamoyltransferase regulatory subunit [Muribaculaceae bacterium]MDE6461440.1 aspartate carbamoyltransferase regulatory subunit [Muribaculaceae bacterium]
MSAESSKKELAVAALRNGTVIDHIPADVLFDVVRLLGIEDMATSVTIGNNLQSAILGRKGIIKVADVVFPEATLNRIALIAPSAKVNIIRDYEVVEKHHVTLPDELFGLVKCNNPKCISNNEPMRSHFTVVNRQPVTIRCHYCGHTQSH